MGVREQRATRAIRRIQACLKIRGMAQLAMYGDSSGVQVIVVAGNYRLDSLGWLALEELQQETPDGSYGNYGLTDQRAVMQWIQRNAAVIGADPESVTIFGQVSVELTARGDLTTTGCSQQVAGAHVSTLYRLHQTTSSRTSSWSLGTVVSVVTVDFQLNRMRQTDLG